MFSLVKFDNDVYTVLPSRRVKLIKKKTCIVKYPGGGNYNAHLIDTSGEFFCIPITKKILPIKSYESFFCFLYKLSVLTNSWVFRILLVRYLLKIYFQMISLRPFMITLIQLKWQYLKMLVHNQSVMSFCCKILSKLIRTNFHSYITNVWMTHYWEKLATYKFQIIRRVYSEKYRIAINRLKFYSKF